METAIRELRDLSELRDYAKRQKPDCIIPDCLESIAMHYGVDSMGELAEVLAHTIGE